MASSQSRGGERMIHQDFIARIRYSNALPPPPVPPKLLDILNTGLASGQYTNPGFASRLAREQPLNIEADAELGMPIDLVGMPGVFEGDESSIQPNPNDTHPIHPRDRALLRPLATLGKPKVNETSVSFLRRTEYISGQQTTSRKVDIFLNKNKDAVPGARRGTPNKNNKRKAASPEPADKGSPAYIKRKIEKSFEAAALCLKDRTKIRHPSKRNVKPVDAYPLLPDLDAFPDSGAYVTVKFTHNPVPSSSVYDTRLLSGIFKPIERTVEEDAMFEAALAAHERDPERFPRPDNKMNYEFYLAADAGAAAAFRRRFDVDDPDRDSRELYPKGSGDVFPFRRVRAYETSQETELDHESKYGEELILAFKDGEDGRGTQKGLYYYPVMQRSTVRAQRSKNIARTVAGMQEGEEVMIDQLDVTVDEPGEELKAHMARYRENPFGWAEEEEEGEGGKEDELSQETAGRSKNGSPGGEGDADADGEEEE
ncbi:Paf1-domain-containing protein [Coniochaeta ligniaria NRRL 30616]|uniref:Paf1-domain-containing protein n=1 Tax=Coniochaeta ligniaria NRRL 30616 TaxID=1408157 RepID=A0A1J7JVI4_9PEZI|nr:Paf1-domain-containing protein [Coniochaeta ligniaria NRRL 30616]